MTPPLPDQKAQNKLAKWSFYMGLLSVLDYILNPAGGGGIHILLLIIISIAAIITGIISLRQIKVKNMKGKGTAIAGIVLGCVPLVLFLLGMILLMWLLTFPS